MAGLEIGVAVAVLFLVTVAETVAGMDTALTLAVAGLAGILALAARATVQVRQKEAAVQVLRGHIFPVSAAAV
jgi:hypothetical protein